MKGFTKRFVGLIVMLTLLIGVFSPVKAQAKTIKLNKKNVTLEVGDTLKLKLNGATAKNVTWKTSDNKVAKVNSSGKVTAIGQGNANISALYKGKKYLCKVTVIGDDAWANLTQEIMNKGALYNDYYYLFGDPYAEHRDYLNIAFISYYPDIDSLYITMDERIDICRFTVGMVLDHNLTQTVLFYEDEYGSKMPQLETLESFEYDKEHFLAEQVNSDDEYTREVISTIANAWIDEPVKLFQNFIESLGYTMKDFGFKKIK